jgi:hypothetical protein
MHIQNAIIESATITTEERGLLTSYVFLDYGDGGHQGFGGFVLHLPEQFKHHSKESGYAGHFIFRVMEIAGVSRWENLKGKTVRVKLNKEGLGGRIMGIGHIVKDDWFMPDEDFKTDSQNK